MNGEKQQQGATEIEKKARKKGSAASRCLLNASSGGGDEAMAALKCQKLAEGDKAEAGKGKRIAQVSQKYIDALLKEQATGAGFYRVSRSKEILDMCKGPTPYDAELRALVARSEAARERLRAGDAKILEQYRLYGKAFTEVDEDISFVYDRPFGKSRPPAPPA